MPTIYSAQDCLRIALERGIIVDEQDKWLLEEYTWSLNHDGYAVTRIPGVNRKMFLHHCIVGYPIWEGDEIDHKDRNRVNNSRRNLHYVNHSGQMLNREYEMGEVDERNITLRHTGKYKVTVYRQKRQVYLGQYDTLKEAISIRNAWFIAEEMHELVASLSARLEAARPGSSKHG